MSYLQPELIDLSGPGVQDKIANREDAAKWGLKDINRYWLGIISQRDFCSVGRISTFSSCKIEMMNILISNDDGYLAPGLLALSQALSSFANVTVVAPDSNRSGASNALTLDRPFR
jgi:hypothetical protein